MSRESFCILLYNAALIGATGYVVFGLGHSGWWFVLTAILLAKRSE